MIKAGPRFGTGTHASPCSMKCPGGVTTRGQNKERIRSSTQGRLSCLLGGGPRVVLVGGRLLSLQHALPRGMLEINPGTIQTGDGRCEREEHPRLSCIFGRTRSLSVHAVLQKQPWKGKGMAYPKGARSGTE